MKLSCFLWKKWIGQYSAGDLELDRPEIAARLAEHIASCDYCRDLADSLRAMDRALRTHARSARINERLDAPTRSRPALSMSNRVLSAIRPDEKYVANTPWTPSTVSFVGVAAFALLLVTFINPESGARTWLLNGLLGKPKTPPAIVKQVTPPFPPNQDPFKAPLAPSVGRAIGADGGTPDTPIGAVPSIARYTAPDTAATDLVRPTRPLQAPLATIAPTQSAPPDTPDAKAPNSVPQSASPDAPATEATTPAIDALAGVTDARLKPNRFVPFQTDSQQTPPSPPQALATGAVPLLRTDVSAQSDGPLSKRSVLQAVGDDPQKPSIFKDHAPLKTPPAQASPAPPDPAAGDH